MVSSNDKFHTKQYTIDNLYESIKMKEIDVNPVWQRKVVWNNKMKRDLIDTIMRGYPINPIVVWDQSSEQCEAICVDGKNRLCAITDFMDNKFNIKWEGADMFFDELDKKVKRRFGMFNIEVRVLRSDVWTDKTIREYFQSIQGGAKLNWCERINAVDNWFVDLLRDIMLATEDDFKAVLGDSCNERFELYAYIANIVSVHTIIQEKYVSGNKRLRRTADTNSSLMKYVVNYNDDDSDITDAEKSILVDFVKDVIAVVSRLKEVQANDIAVHNVSIWFLTTSDKVNTRIKPCIKDFTSFAYYIQQQLIPDVDAIVADLTTIFSSLVAAFLEDSKNHDVIDYYITYGKNQKQYTLSSVEKRYELMLKYL